MKLAAVFALFPLLTVAAPAPPATVTFFALVPDETSTPAFPEYEATISLSGFDSANSIGTYVEVDVFPSQSEFGLAATTQTATIIDGPSEFIYLASDSVEGAFTESCAVSGASASCVAIAHQGSPGPTGVFYEASLPVATQVFEGSFGGVLTAEVSDGIVVMPSGPPPASDSAAPSGSAVSLSA